MDKFLELTDAAYVHGPQVPGIYPYSKERNMSVGGSKGSICGNYAMNECDLIIALGARGVCQWDCSGTAFRKAKKMININCDYDDLGQYNNSVRIQGDAQEVLIKLNELLRGRNLNSDPEWIHHKASISCERHRIILIACYRKGKCRRNCKSHIGRSAIRNGIPWFFICHNLKTVRLYITCIKDLNTLVFCCEITCNFDCCRFCKNLLLSFWIFKDRLIISKLFVSFPLFFLLNTPFNPLWIGIQVSSS